MRCVDVNNDGKIDFVEFVDRFHNPAKEIGFNLAVLLTNLAEHIPNDVRLGRLLEKAKSVIDYFEAYLGRIEIMGSANRIERVYFEINQNNIDQWEKPQIRESKRSFLHSAVGETDEKEKLEIFVNFCEDTIFEMQHAASLSDDQPAAVPGQTGGEGGNGDAEKKEMEPGTLILEALKGGYALICWIVSFLFYLISLLTWSNIRYAVTTISSMTATELLMATAQLQVKAMLAIVRFVFLILKTLGLFILNMMRGPGKDDDTASRSAGSQLSLASPEATKAKGGPAFILPGEDEEDGVSVFGIKMLRKGDGNFVVTPEQEEELVGADAASLSSSQQSAGQQPGSGNNKALPKARVFANVPDTSLFRKGDVVEDTSKDQKGNNYFKTITGILARNFYRFKYIALGLTFIINFILLFSTVHQQTVEPGEEIDGDEMESAVEGAVEQAAEAVSQLVEDIANATEAVLEAAGSGEGDDEGDEEPNVIEWVTIAPDMPNLEPLLRLLSCLHTMVALGLVIGYYCLKVPLVLFKREKEVSRRLEFDGLWIAEQPADDDLRGHWDKLVLGTPSFPNIYWDKFVKKKVVAKYSEQFDKEQIVALLGVDKPNTPQTEGRFAWWSNLDLQYLIWKWGVIFTDQPFLYILFYFLLSAVGNFYYFAFACHLIDIAVSIKTLQTILLSVMQNGRQLILTTMLLSVVVYFYTVLAFNFFRQFYVFEEEGEEKDAKCHDMLTCYAFHLYKGVRAGE